MESHRIKNALGELTFGEYWNIAGCTAYAVKSKGKTCTTFGPENNLQEPCIRFYFDGYGNMFVPLRAKAKAVGHKVVTEALGEGEVTLDFYELTPASHFNP